MLLAAQCDTWGSLDAEARLSSHSLRLVRVRYVRARACVLYGQLTSSSARILLWLAHGRVLYYRPQIWCSECTTSATALHCWSFRTRRLARRRCVPAL